MSKCQSIQSYRLVVWLQKQRGKGKCKNGSRDWIDVGLWAKEFRYLVEARKKKTNSSLESPKRSQHCQTLMLDCLHVCAKSSQSCPTICDSMDHSTPVFSVQAILQARILDWIAMPSSKGSSQPRDQTHVSYLSLALAGGFFITRAT